MTAHQKFQHLQILNGDRCKYYTVQSFLGDNSAGRLLLTLVRDCLLKAVCKAQVLF